MAIPRNKYDDIYKYAGKHFNGQSYILHADVLLHNAYKYEYREIAQYLCVSFHASYADYVTTGETTLDLAECEVDQEYFKITVYYVLKMVKYILNTKKSNRRIYTNGTII